MYPEVQLFVDGAWTNAAAGRFLDVMNPSTGEPVGKVAHADRSDLDRALEAADKGFKAWRKVSAFDRSKVMRKAANLLAGLISQADLLVFPVDCISHHAALTAKQLCRQSSKRFIPLRSASATSLLAALRRPEVGALAVQAGA